MKKRLESLDVLRGADLFFLVALGPIINSLASAANSEWLNRGMWIFRHVEWEGFAPWDIIMPLFMFMAGATIPFALARYRTDCNTATADSKSKALWRIAKRVVLLWIFGMMCQGNLLGLNPDRIYFYSNTLQSIAMGYLISALLFLHTGIRTQIVIAVALLLGFWGAMELITVQGYGGGNYTPDGNLAEWLEREVLGRFRDGTSVVNGEVVFPEWYRYTWILSSLNFGVTVLTGTFAGYILKEKGWTPERKLTWLVIIGVSMLTAGWTWGIWHPVIKKLWTSSMVLVSSGYCFLLMALFYYIIDYKGWKRHTGWLKVYGMNSIVAYMLAMCVNFSCIGHSLFHGLQPYMGEYYSVVLTLSNVGIIYFILWELYKRKLFLRV